MIRIVIYILNNVNLKEIIKSIPTVIIVYVFNKKAMRVKSKIQQKGFFNELKRTNC